MYRVTTPTHTFTLPFDTSEIDEILLTYRQKDKVVLNFGKNDLTFDGDKIINKLTQEETAKFCDDSIVEIQARVKMNSGDVIASNILKVRARRVLNEVVL